MKYFTIEELSASQTANKKGIDNTPTEEHKINLKALVDNVLDKTREWYGQPIIVTSGYRNNKLNNSIGGVKKSQHNNGQAADIVAKNMKDNAKLFQYIKNNLQYDQLIWEKGNDTNPSWIHVSYTNKINRKQVLKTKDGKNYSIYT